MAPGDLIVRAAAPEDAAALLEIYAPYVEKTAITFEYAVPSPEEFAGRIARTLERYPYLAAEAEGRIMGYAYAGPFKERAAYDWAVETTVYVREEAKRQGVGRTLYAALERCLAAQGVLNLNACVACPEREDEYLTRDSVDFHRRMGYRLAGEFRQCGCKFGRWYNMVWMEKHIGLHPADPPPVKPFSEVLRLGPA
ncbi:N-acetyltransferase family protein [Oscillospiraceae bacterium 50-60]